VKPISGRALLLAALLGSVALGILAQPSAAMTTFSGSCESRTWVSNFPGRTVLPIPSGYAYHGTGHCKGTLNGAPFDGPVQMDLHADMKTLMSCEFGYSTDGGPLYYTFLTGGSKAGIPAAAHPPSAQTSSAAPPPRLSRAERRAKAHAARKKGHRRKHRKRKKPRRHSPAAATSSTPAPAPAAAEPPQNPVLAMWVTEVHTGTQIVNNFFGAYRGYGEGLMQFEPGPENLGDCISHEGNAGLWTHGTMNTITEMRG
jgi:hypothetical protein